MDYRRKEIDLRMEMNKNSGWTVTSVPVPCPPIHKPELEKPPIPETLPEPEYTPPEDECVHIVPEPAPYTPPSAPTAPIERDSCGYCVTIGMAYVPMQKFRDVYEAAEGFSRGTIFAELDLPYIERGGCRYD